MDYTLRSFTSINTEEEFVQWLILHSENEIYPDRLGVYNTSEWVYHNLSWLGPYIHVKFLATKKHMLNYATLVIAGCIHILVYGECGFWEYLEKKIMEQ